ncbi:hypothetical protein [Alienimonas sp. DA493]|uniref:hypothetical protein n=1 Tax=Alienimonas sp. DA493 TaxID=3373605 RepID=UPI0037542072
MKTQYTVCRVTRRYGNPATYTYTGLPSDGPEPAGLEFFDSREEADAARDAADGGDMHLGHNEYFDGPVVCEVVGDVDLVDPADRREDDGECYDTDTGETYVVRECDGE